MKSCSVGTGSLALSISLCRFTVTELLAGVGITHVSTPLLKIFTGMKMFVLLYPSNITSVNILIKLNTGIRLLIQGLLSKF